MKERTGLMYISDAIVHGEIEAIGEMLAYLKFVPCHVEYEYVYKRFKYIGYSPFFEEIEEGTMAPEYTVIISEIEGDKKYEVQKR